MQAEQGKEAQPTEATLIVGNGVFPSGGGLGTSDCLLPGGDLYATTPPKQIAKPENDDRDRTTKDSDPLIPSRPQNAHYDAPPFVVESFNGTSWENLKSWLRVTSASVVFG